MHSVTVAYNLARLWEQQGRLEKAVPAYTSILKQHPNYVDCFVRLAACERAAERLTAATWWLKKGLEVHIYTIVYMYVYVCIYIHRYRNSYRYICVCVYTYTHIYISFAPTYLYACERAAGRLTAATWWLKKGLEVHIYTIVYMYVYVCIYIHIYIETVIDMCVRIQCVYIYTHIYIIRPYIFMCLRARGGTIDGRHLMPQEGTRGIYI